LNSFIWFLDPQKQVGGEIFFRFGDFYRLVQEPSRWHRMLALPEFAAAVLKQRG
jgi:hypothetical protein